MRIISSGAIFTFFLVSSLFVSVDRANAAGDCGVQFYYGRTETQCGIGNHYNYTEVNSASWPYNGSISGPCVSPFQYSNVYYNPQTTGVQFVSQPSC